MAKVSMQANELELAISVNNVVVDYDGPVYDEDMTTDEWYETLEENDSQDFDIEFDFEINGEVDDWNLNCSGTVTTTLHTESCPAGYSQPIRRCSLDIDDSEFQLLARIIGKRKLIDMICEKFWQEFDSELDDAMGNPPTDTCELKYLWMGWLEERLVEEF